MPKRTSDRGSANEKPRMRSLKLSIDVIESARIVAAFRGQSMADLVGDILRPALAALEKEEIAKRARIQKGKTYD